MPIALAATGAKTLPDVSITHSLLQMVIALAVIVGCIWGLGKILTRMRSGTGTPKRAAKAGKGAGSGLAIVSRQSLGKDLAIATVRWGDREVLVGIAGSTITFLNDARAEDAGTPIPAPAPAPAPQFAEPSAVSWAPSPALFSSMQPALVQSSDERSASFIEALRNATSRR
jgi:flagellar biogenesis protein FliO